MSDNYRQRAEEYRARRMADVYEKQADANDRAAAIHARRVLTGITVRGTRYRVSMNYSDNGGEWYGNAHAPGSIFPDAHVHGHPTRKACIEALRSTLEQR